MKKKLQRFFTLTRQEAGFTLVELIVVIAILAILAGIAVPAYSGYVTKANQQADITLISEIEHALELGFYSGEITGDGYVILSLENAPDYGNNEQVLKALNATFGSDLSNVKLIYDGWASTYEGSSLAGKEDEVMANVGTLSSKLSSALSTNRELLMGQNFTNYLTSKGYDPDNMDAGKMSELAVLYAADSSSKADKTTAVNATLGLKVLGQDGSTMDDTNNAILTMSQAYGGSTFSGLAAMYAVAEGYSRYINDEYQDDTSLKAMQEATSNIDPNSVTDVNAAKLAVLQIFGAVKDNAPEGSLDKYFEEQAAKDAEAYIDLMGTVKSAENTIIQEIEAGNGLTSSTLTGMLQAYADGSVLIMIDVEDTSFTVSNTAESE